MSKLHIKWDAPATDPDSYEIKYKKIGGNIDNIINTTGTSIVIENLEENKQYEVSIRSVCGRYKSDWTSLNTITCINSPI
jgi:hypothetical protein